MTIEQIEALRTLAYRQAARYGIYLEQDNEGYLSIPTSVLTNTNPENDKIIAFVQMYVFEYNITLINQKGGLH